MNGPPLSASLPRSQFKRSPRKRTSRAEGLGVPEHRRGQTRKKVALLSLAGNPSRIPPLRRTRLESRLDQAFGDGARNCGSLGRSAVLECDSCREAQDSVLHVSAPRLMLGTASTVRCRRKESRRTSGAGSPSPWTPERCYGRRPRRSPPSIISPLSGPMFYPAGTTPRLAAPRSTGRPARVRPFSPEPMARRR